MAGEDPEYLEYLRGEPCCSCGRWGASVPHHKTGAGMGTRAHDHEAMPLCDDLRKSCHRDLHQFQGAFEGMSRLLRATWQDTQIQEHRARYTMGRAAVPY